MAAPTANAGEAQTVEPYRTVTLTGTDSDSDGTVSTRSWRQVSGPAVTLSGATTATATYKSPGTLAGTSLVFGYTVTDDAAEQSPESTVTHTIMGATERVVIGGVEVPVEISVVTL